MFFSNLSAFYFFLSLHTQNSTEGGSHMVGIYSRQSLDKPDSLSIDQQIEICRAHAGTDDITVYTDAGFSGGNMHRPGLQRLLQDAEQGKLSKIICYRLDRFSRSLLDFAETYEKLRRWNVSLISATESFDTATPIGNAMIFIIMVFAQMERETIILRGTDNYYKRLREGVWPGGKAPFGFDIIRRPIHGKSQPVLQPNASMSHVQWLFDAYAAGTASLGALARVMEQRLPSAQCGKRWSSTAIQRILNNPVYAEADADLYAYYYQAGLHIMADIQEFDGQHSALRIGMRNRCQGRKLAIQEQKLYVTAFPPVIPSDVFLTVQRQLSRNRQIRNDHPSQYSWLSGRLSCSHCGHSIRLNHPGTAAGRRCYLVCSNRGRHPDACPIRHTESIESVEACTIAAMRERMLFLADHSHGMADPAVCSQINQLKLQQIDIQVKQKKLLEAMAVGGAAAAKLIRPELEQLEATASDVSHTLEQLVSGQSEATPPLTVDFDRLDRKGKRQVAALLIDRVYVAPDTIDIHWKE